MFERDYTINDMMCDDSGNMSPFGFFWLLNDIMEKNAESYGLGTDYHLARNLAWVLIAYDIHIFAALQKGDCVTAGTLPYAFKKMYGFRKYRFKDKNGTVILEGKAKFVLVNIKTKALVKPPLEMLDKFTDAKKEPDALPFDKIRYRCDHPFKAQTMTIDDALIDVNGHVNNANYLKLTTQFTNHKIRPPERMRVEYKKEVFAKDTIVLQGFKHNHNIVHVRVARDNEVCTEVVFEKL